MFGWLRKKDPMEAAYEELFRVWDRNAEERKSRPNLNLLATRLGVSRSHVQVLGDSSLDDQSQEVLEALEAVYLEARLEKERETRPNCQLFDLDDEEDENDL